ncbi:IclR family transcriptional regulator [Nesterenkonia xinjiangensis]|uniref:IclR family pca regulon transcriptional regulator/IclR family acetate operon transcriptional repressor n=1 Tax=Nesterenkonia xinjiangensis TaxID=225327 RepID=A0A7Z0GM81_9MICC|nr:IclR family transcriptional regulator [Nesterenkonia xinjiangensis]NYJ78490.1 IclR family pca regulon transcriptional regulator/IclR family acetate operon transcriptional repressor [Nesterenkonia xinjiangensis]
MNTSGNKGRTLERAFDVLRSLENARSPIRLSEVSRETGLHIATTQRIMATLVNSGYAQTSENGYTLGPVALAQAHAFVLQDPLVKAARPVLTELSDSTGLTASIFVRSGFDRILTARVEAPEPMRYQFPIGRRLPLDVGAGKPLLAHLPDEELQEYFEDYSGPRLASGEQQTAESLRSELSEIRETGYHLGLSERVLGTVSVAAVIRSARGEVAGVLNIVAHDDTVSVEALRRRVPEVLRAAELIGQQV